MGQGFPSQRLGVNLSAGTGLANTGTVVLSNSNNISFGMSFGSSSNIVTASFAQSVQPGPSAIAAGTQTATSGTVIFSNSNGISFGMAGSATITAQMPSVSLFKPDGEHENPIPFQGSSTAINMSLRRISVPFQISATEMDIPAHLTVAGSTAGSFTISAAIYTFSGSTASSASSGSVAYTFNSGTNTNAASIYGGNSGTRWRSMSINTWNLTPGEYLIGIMGSINGPSGTTGSMTMFGLSSLSIVGAIGGGNYSKYFADGVFASGTGAFPASIHLSAIVQTGASALGQPHFRLVGTGP